MFLPQTDETVAEKQEADKARREGYSRIEQWAQEALPGEISQGVTITVQEIQCGDPNCSPIDTAVAIMFPR